MNLQEFEKEFSKLREGYKTKDLDQFNKQLIKQQVDVSFLKDIVLTKQQYHRTYFQVSLGQMKKIEEQLKFIEDNFELLQDWWHVDQLTQFLAKDFTFDYAFSKAQEYVKNDLPYARRWGYVMFMPRLVKEEAGFDKLLPLFHEDEVYHVVMAEAWLISYMAMYHVEKTYDYIASRPLSYDIMGKAIQKICDSYRVSQEDKERFKELRKLWQIQSHI